MFLDYLALFILLLGLTLVLYTFAHIFNLPYKIAKERDHPHAEAIYVACWLALFTLEALWPFVFLWAVSHKKGETARVVVTLEGVNGDLATTPDGDFAHRLDLIEDRVRGMEAAAESKQKPGKRL